MCKAALQQQGAPMSAKSDLQNPDTIRAEGYRRPGEELESIPRAPPVPEKKLRTKLAGDANSAGPELVSVRSRVSLLLSFSRMSCRENPPGLWGLFRFLMCPAGPSRWPQPLRSVFPQVKPTSVPRKANAPRGENQPGEAGLERISLLWFSSPPTHCLPCSQFF